MKPLVVEDLDAMENLTELEQKVLEVLDRKISQTFSRLGKAINVTSNKKLGALVTGLMKKGLVKKSKFLELSTRSVYQYALTPEGIKVLENSRDQSQEDN